MYELTILVERKITLQFEFVARSRMDRIASIRKT